MEVKVYNKEGRVISEVQREEGIDTPGHYEFRMSENGTEVEFIRLTNSTQEE